jgi:mannose/fructose-specific phosphotransferase system component IIA
MMSEPLRGIVVAHGELARGLLSAVKCITGVDDALVAISNEGLGANELRAELARVCASCPVVVFVDLVGGSCAMAGLGVQHMMGEVPVLTGVNLPMLIDFVFQRELPIGELIERLEAKGRAGITAHVA